MITEFFSSGNEYVNELFSVIHKKIDPGFKPEKILDFGCGPGRLVIPFSRIAHEVLGIDVSQDMINEAKKNCLKYNAINTSFLVSDDNLHCIKNQHFDLVNAFIVLQHINIKRGEKLIQLLIESIKDKGIGVLHLTYHDHYPYRGIVNYFRYRIPFLSIVMRFFRSTVTGKKFKNLPLMQMNNYNLNRIFYLLQRTNIKEVYSTFTNHYNYWGVILYFRK